MHKTNIENLDLNLLLALKALLEEKHVTRAATRIGLSQPAMSRVLARLRSSFQDLLLVKGAAGLELSTRANEIYQPLLNILADINQLITPPCTQPCAMHGEIVIATRDNEMVSILPQVINRITKEAPNLTLRIVSLSGDDLSLLESNQVDFIITASKGDAASLFRTQLYKEDHVCLLAKNNSAAKNFTLEKFIQMNHCLVTITGFGPGVVDSALKKKGLQRNIAVRVPHFFAASYIVANTDLIATVPRKVGLALSQEPKIILLEPPLKIPSFTIYLYWHIRNKNNPTHKWLRKLIPENLD